MLNIEVNRSAEGVERYFDRELAVSDYLMKEPGVWAGRGAERLGLRGPVERTQFVALLRNEDPTSGKRLTARKNTSRQEDGKEVSNRQVGYGLVFGVPKSVSIYLAITGAKFSPASENEFCPVCMLREALAGGAESGKSFSEDPAKPTLEDTAHRFEHRAIR